MAKKIDIAKKIMVEMWGKDRSQVVARIMDEAGMNQASASVYYSNLKGFAATAALVSKDHVPAPVIVEPVKEKSVKIAKVVKTVPTKKVEEKAKLLQTTIGKSYNELTARERAKMTIEERTAALVAEKQASGVDSYLPTTGEVIYVTGKKSKVTKEDNAYFSQIR